jgi:hypothetical protein
MTPCIDTPGDIDDAIDALVNYDKGNSELHLRKYGQ